MLSWFGFRRGSTAESFLDRRVYERHQLGQDSSCRVIVTMGQGSRPAAIVDLSLTGVGFLFHQPIEPGRLIIAMLTNPAWSFSKLLSVRVAHCSEQEDRQYLVGCGFTHPLTEEDLQAMLA